MAAKTKDRMTPEGIKFQKMLKELADKEVRIGFQHGKATEKDGTDICDIAAWNELGTENIRSRPFMRESVDSNEEKIVSFMQAQIVDIIKNRKTAEQAFKEIGVFQKRLMQETISDGSFEKNTKATIKKKKSSKPLIDTGRMRQSVNYVIQKKGSGD